MENNLPNTASGTLLMMPENRTESINFFNLIKKEMLAGYANPVHIFLIIKTLQELSEKFLKDKDIKDIIEEKLTQNKNRLEFGDGVIELRNKTKYNFNENAKWVELENKIINLKNEQKDLEAFLKTIKEVLADVDGGEIITPISKEQTDIIVTTFKTKK